jgi:hypothetical protein
MYFYIPNPQKPSRTEQELIVLFFSSYITSFLLGFFPFLKNLGSFLLPLPSPPAREEGKFGREEAPFVKDISRLNWESESLVDWKENASLPDWGNSKKAKFFNSWQILS